jgi:hypothetical protein
MPGFGLNELGGRSFVREMVEWKVPPRIFESAGTPGFYLAWMRPEIFAAVLWTDPQDRTLRKRYESLGTQLDFRFHVFHWYEMTLSAGYAVGYKAGRRAGDEWMVSLKIM